MAKTITFTPLGDYLFVYGDDAWAVAAALGLVVTHQKRTGRNECAIPKFSAEERFADLLRAGIVAQVGTLPSGSVPPIERGK